MRIRKTSQYIEGGATLPNYSTEEIKTGSTWINGKPVYRKVINFGALPNSTSKNVSTGLTNVKYINMYGIATNGSNYFPINRVTSQSAGIIGSFIYDNSVYIETSADRTGYTAEIVIEYTKTTD